MKDQQSTWITIPEDVIHTPVSDVKREPRVQNTGNEWSAKNKWFWGISFVVLVVAALALLAPRELTSVLQGNLFDTSAPTDSAGKPNAFGVTPLSFLPAKTTDSTVAETETETVATPNPSSAPVTQNQVVQAETAPVAVQVEPVSATPTPPVSSRPEGSGPSTTGPSTGPSIGASTGASTGVNPIISDLEKQLQALQQQTNAATHPAAPTPTSSIGSSTGPSTGSSTGASTGNIPDFAQATQNLGQQGGMQPIYRANLHRVTVQPQAILNGYLSTGKILPTANVTGNAMNQSVYAANLPGAQKTPDSGPSESLAIAFAITFLGLLGWKSLRVMMG